MTGTATARSRGRHGATVLLCCTLLAGCAATDSRRTRFYVVEPLPADVAPLAVAQAAPRVNIGELRLPQYLQRPQIVTRAADNQLALAEYHQWAGNLAKNLARALGRNLSRLLASAQVTVFSRRPARDGRVRVEVEVLEFERGPHARVQLAAQWQVRGARRRDDLMQVTELRSEPLEQPPRMDATVRAMGELWGELSRRIARAILEREG